MRNDCPTCNTVYTVTTQDVGKRIICKKCGAALVIADDGFRLDLSVSAPRDNVEEPVRSKAKLSPIPDLTQAKEIAYKYVDLPTLLFGIGAFFILTFAFFPMIGRAKQDRRVGTYAEEKLDKDQEITKLREKGGNEEKIKKMEEDWTKRVPVLEADIKYAEISNQRSGYYDRYGMLFGFVLLMVGSLGMVRAETHLVKRIFGAVVLGLQMILVFSTSIGGCRGLPGG